MGYYNFIFALFLIGLQTLQAQDSKKKFTPTAELHGRIHYDFEFLHQKDGIAPGEDYLFSGQQFRRVFLQAKGTIFDHIRYVAQFAFNGGEVAYRDLYIAFTDLPVIGGELAFGSVTEPTGLEMETSSKYLVFFERSMMTHTQNFRWNSGFHYSNFGLLNGKLGLQLSYAFNGDHNEGFLDKQLDRGQHFVVRFTSLVYQKKQKNISVHLGTHYENRKRDKEPASYTLSFRPENHMGETIKVVIDSLKTQQDIGFELAGTIGSLTLQGEYEIAGYNTEENGTLNVNGYYASASYCLTGEHHQFKKGAETRLIPNKDFNFDKGGWGAVELAIRYSVLDYSDIVTTGYNDKVSNVTLGVNWYLNAHTRFVYNHVMSDLHSPEENPLLQADLFRVLVDF